MDLLKFYIEQSNEAQKSRRIMKILSEEARADIYSIVVSEQKPTFVGYIKTQKKMIALNLLAPSLLVASMLITRELNQTPSLIFTFTLSIFANILLFNSYKTIHKNNLQHKIDEVIAKDVRRNLK